MADTCTLDTVADVTPGDDGCEPGEDWWWCYPGDLFFGVEGAPPSPSHS